MPARTVRAALLALLLAAGAAGADWLVLDDGARLETHGPWKVEGRQVLFTDEFGAARSLRLKDVDLEASRAATERAHEATRWSDEADAEAASRPQVGGAVEAKEPALVLTDADVGHVDRGQIQQRAEAQKPRVILYMTSWCGYCRKARALLRQLEVPFVEKDIERSAAARSEYQKKGRGYTGVPLLDIDGTILRGFSEQRIRQLVAKLREPEATG